jgi:hypothetical protein
MAQISLAYLPTYLPAYLPTYPHTYHSTYLHTHPAIRTLTHLYKGKGRQAVRVHVMNEYTGADI